MLMIYFCVILLGVASGVSHFDVLHTIGFTISDVFIKIFKCISLPIISLSIIVTISQYSSSEGMKKTWQRTLGYTIGTTLLAATVAFILYLMISPPNLISTVSLSTKPVMSGENYLKQLASLIPDNIFSPFLEHQVMGALLISMIMGVAIRYIPDEASKRAISYFFKGAHSIFLVITGWVIKVIPLALYGFIVTTIQQMKSGMNIAGLTSYLSVIVLANLIQGCIILPLLLSINRIKPFHTLRAMMPALSVAFFSKSSAGTLPVTMRTAESNLGMSSSISRFVLPLCTSINMNGCAAFIFTTVVYVMQNNGVQLSLAKMILWIFIATIAAIGNAGVPMGCFFLSASLLTSMNIPITLMGLILPFYSLIDMIETALNVWSDSCVAKIVDEKLSRADGGVD